MKKKSKKRLYRYHHDAIAWKPKKNVEMTRTQTTLSDVDKKKGVYVETGWRLVDREFHFKPGTKKYGLYCQRKRDCFKPGSKEKYWRSREYWYDSKQMYKQLKQEKKK